MPYLCHVTSVLNCSHIKNCLSFSNFFLLSDSFRQKIVLMMTEQVQSERAPQAKSRVAIYEYVIENPFDIRQAREYPLLDYSVSGSIKHFNDNQYVYVAVTR